MLLSRALRSRRIRPPRRRQIGRSLAVGRSSLRSPVEISLWTSRDNTGSVRSVGILANLDQASAIPSARRRWRAGSGVHRGTSKQLRPSHTKGAQHKQRYLFGPTNVRAQTTQSGYRRDRLTGFAVAAHTFAKSRNSTDWTRPKWGARGCAPSRTGLSIVSMRLGSLFAATHTVL